VRLLLVSITFVSVLVSIGADVHRSMVASAPGRITLRRALPYEELDLRHELECSFSGQSIKTAVARAALFDCVRVNHPTP